VNLNLPLAASASPWPLTWRRKLILDADGAALRNGISARPNVIKSNVAEAERLVGRKLPDNDAILQMASA
jgi:fructose-1-phosphate kinase PfkB-like protein